MKNEEGKMRYLLILVLLTTTANAQTPPENHSGVLTREDLAFLRCTQSSMEYALKIFEIVKVRQGKLLSSQEIEALYYEAYSWCDPKKPH
jgi:hypothetical protein